MDKWLVIYENTSPSYDEPQYEALWFATREEAVADFTRRSTPNSWGFADIDAYDTVTLIEVAHREELK